MSHHTIDIEDLRYTYPDGTVALRGVSLHATHGESIAIVGANGAGKSTLLMHLVGLLTPQSGSVSIGGVPVTPSTLPEIRRTVGMVFQDPDDQLFMPSVFDDVAFGPINLGLPETDVRARVEEALVRVGALRLADRPPYRLSGGEKRAVSIATVLALSPSVLVLDEPSSNLDPKARRRLIELVRSFEHTRLVATHDLDLALDVCERTVVLRDGVVAADGPTLEVLSDDAGLEASGLERPLRLQACPVCGGASASG